MTTPGPAPYAEQLHTEGRHWDSFSLRMLAEGTVPFCCDFRLHLTQLALRRDGLPQHFGAGLLPTRFREVANVLGGAARRIDAGKVEVLDVGSGGGWLALELARQGGRVRGLDVSQENLDLARFFAERQPASVPFLHPRLAGLPLRAFGSVAYDYGDLNRPLTGVADRSVDVVTVWDALHHVRDLSVLFAEVARVLRPDGIFIGHDYVGPTPETTAVSDHLQEAIRGLFRSCSAAELTAFRGHVVRLGPELPLHANATDPWTPPDDARGYVDALVAELRERFSLASRDLAPPESPFEEVSISYLLTELEQAFDVRAFYTMGAYLPEDMPPPAAEPDDLGSHFFHYLSWLFLALDDLVIDSGAATGRWFCFAATRRGATTDVPSFTRTAPDLLERLRGEPPARATDDPLRARLRLLEAENRVLRRLLRAPIGPSADAQRFYLRVVRPLLSRFVRPLSG